MIVPSVNPTAAAAATPSIPAIAAHGAPIASVDIPPATATISPWATLMNRLQTLAATDPAGLSAVAGQLAQKVDAAATQANGDEKASLAKFATALTQVAKDGDVSALKPAHHHHVRAAKHLNGGTGALLSNLLQDVDAVLGPNANVTTQT